MLNDNADPEGDTTTAEGNPRLVSIVAVDGRDHFTLLALAASLARSLDTPVAAAIVQSAREREIEIRPVEQFQHATATGIAGTVAGHAVVLGTATLFRDLRISVDSLRDWPERLQRRGEQVLFVAIDGRATGFIGVAETHEYKHTHTDVMEDEMRDVVSTADQFPTQAADLPKSQPTESIELVDGD